MYERVRRLSIVKCATSNKNESWSHHHALEIPEPHRHERSSRAASDRKGYGGMVGCLRGNGPSVERSFQWRVRLGPPSLDGPLPSSDRLQPDVGVRTRFVSRA